LIDLVSSDIIDDGAVKADLMRIADHGHREGIEYVNPKVDIAFLGVWRITYAGRFVEVESSEDSELAW
jgi:hypothetical protein